MNDLNEKKNTQADPGSLDSLREEFGADNKHFQRWQVISLLLMVYDAVAVNIAYLAALWLRHDCQFSAIEARFLNPWKGFAPFYTVAALLVFWFLRLYKSVWRFASYTELVRICMASVITFVIHTVGITMMYRRMPMTYYFFGAILQFILIIGVRFSYRFVLAIIQWIQARAVRKADCQADGSANKRQQYHGPALGFREASLQFFNHFVSSLQVL